jgi:hypothetical protein
MKTRYALTSSALALFGAVTLGALSAPAEAQAVGGYYTQAPAYYYPPPPPPPAYYYPAPTYYYPPPPPPAYYYPAPAYYPEPSYWAPGIGLNFVFGFGGHGGHRWHHH